jgi:hypothetical protein
VKVTVHFLSELTGKHRNTVKKHLSDLSPDEDGRYDSTKALQLLYIGDGGVTHSEALRRLAIAREAETRQRELKLKIENDLKCKRVISAERVLEFMGNCFIAIKAKITSSHLSEVEQNAILLDLAALQDDPNL